mgnify:CR=1 FL=1
MKLLIKDKTILYNLGYAVDNPICPITEVEVQLIDDGIGVKSYDNMEERNCYEQFTLSTNNELYYCCGRAVIKSTDKVLIRTVKIIMELLKSLESEV